MPTYDGLLVGALDSPEGTFTDLAVGGNHACALNTEGYVECWGDNTFGAATPPLFIRYTAIDAGDDHTCGLSVDGEVHCWGQPVPSTVPPL